jgi:predicted RNA-binding Zn-ribbon protein involved in translation (DUF1610 family)
MSDYISKTGLLQAIRREKCLRGYEESYIPLSELKIACEKATVDHVATVLEAEWRPRNPLDPDNSPYFCSVCKANVSPLKTLYYKYCPECGSKMISAPKKMEKSCANCYWSIYNNFGRYHSCALTGDEVEFQGKACKEWESENDERDL